MLLRLRGGRFSRRGRSNLKVRTKLMRRHLSGVAILLAAAFAGAGYFSSGALLADETKSAKKIEPWKPEDFIYAETASQYKISPDGKWLVWVKSTADKEKDGRVSNLFLSSLTENREIQLTRGTDTFSQPKWSPDGEWIAFIGNRARPQGKPDNSKTQIWLISTRGGEPWPLTEFSRGPRQIEWLDKDILIYSAQEDPTEYEQELKKKKDDSEIVDDAEHEAPVRLFKIGVKSKKVTRLTTNTDWIEGWGVSKDGKYVAASHAKSLHYAFDQKTPPITVLHNLTSGQEKQVLTEGRIRAEEITWAADNSGFYAASPYSTDPRFTTAGITILYFYDVASGKGAQVNLDWENGLGFGLQAVPGGFVTFLAAGSHEDIARYAAEKTTAGWAWKRETLTGDHAKNLENFAISEDGKTIAYSSSTASKMSQLFRAQLDGAKMTSPVQITKLNDGLVTERAYAKSEVIRWKGSNNEEVEGILYYPANYEAGKKYPLITAIHGGPMGSDHDLWGESWAYPIQLFTDRGAFVLRPNYHGSNNYGLKWAESICCGKYYDLETPDINAGVDYLIAQGKADPDRIGTMGWSNGSILSTSLITTYPERYKVASVGAGDIEWISDWGNVDFGQSFDAYYFGKSPFEDPQLYLKKSPFFKMDKIQAPVLIFHGTADRNVPPAQSWSYFRALQHFGKVPVKFVVFPDEPHGPRKLTHQVRKVSEEIDWFDKYFFKTTKPENEALKKGSPLEEAEKRASIKKVGLEYGIRFPDSQDPKKPETYPGAHIVPEVVRRGELEIGRFEVTQTQLHSCGDKNSGMPQRNRDEQGFVHDNSDRPNYPAIRVSLDDAKTYIACLSKLTGQQWRLPYEDEVKSLYENRDGENTLDYWAAYSPNPEDTARLRDKAKELKGTAPLLKEVGSFRGQGKEDEEPIYDLGGNVAEWVLTRDGKGKVMGGSADCPADAKSNCTPAPEYIGFRVVRGAAKPAPAEK
jgi:dipeptidyl aminopeptidase/acylaminoacyl peptidase/formylglycine-generating enzyme required for sulfatase activity